MRGSRWGEDDERDWTDTRQVCLNGHVITDYAVSQPQSRRSHCGECGAPTITACQICGNAMRGYRHISGVFHVSSHALERACPDCGNAHPWTAAKQEVVAEWLAAIDSWTDSERAEVKGLLPEIYMNTPRSELALFKLKKHLAGIDPDTLRPFVKALREAAHPSLSDSV